MWRYPDGAFGKAVFQKHAPSHTPDWIRRHGDLFAGVLTTRRRLENALRALGWRCRDEAVASAGCRGARGA